MNIIIPQELKRHIAKRLGLNHKTFFELEKTFAKEYERSIREKQESKKRERAPGGGRKRVLSPEGVFILVLIKLLFNPVFHSWDGCSEYQQAAATGTSSMDLKH